MIDVDFGETSERMSLNLCAAVSKEGLPTLSVAPLGDPMLMSLCDVRLVRIAPAALPTAFSPGPHECSSVPDRMAMLPDPKPAPLTDEI